jgi:hypothetical protein
MSALTLTITNAGLSAIANAGTLGPVVITQVGIGSGSWATAPTASATALISEIKKLTVDGSSTPSPGLIHINASDMGTDAYSVKEVGLYSSTGVLIAIAGGTANILTKAAGSVALVAIDLSVVNVPVGSLTIGNTGFTYPPATETVKGVAEIATTAEVAAGTDNERIVTPAKLAAAGFVKKSGDTMTGPLVLPAAPTADLQAATKAYVDGFVKKSGDTMTGPIVLSANPTAALQAAPKQYVDGTLVTSANGYTRLPNGLILQWGTGASAGSYAVQTIAYPIAFTTAVLNVIVVGTASSNSASAHDENNWKVCASPAPTLTNFQCFNAWTGSQGQGNAPKWLAIGY